MTRGISSESSLFVKASFQCYSDLSDILVKISIPLELELNVRISSGYMYLLPVSLNSQCVSVLSAKGCFRSVIYLYPMADDLSHVTK